MTPASVAYSVGLTAATTWLCTDTSRTKSPRVTTAVRKRSRATLISASDQRNTEGNPNTANATTATTPAPVPINQCLRLERGAMATSWADVSAIRGVAVFRSAMLLQGRRRRSLEAAGNACGSQP